MPSLWSSPWSNRPVLTVAAALVAVAGCSSSDPNRSGFFEPYRIEVPQGNYVDQIMLDQIKLGMTRDQVKFALGTPLMVDVFHPDRWDYVFRFQHRNLSAELRRATVVFVDGKVSEIEAVALPQYDKGNDPALPGYRRTQGRNR
jgi:outer membrane protein assembly factor BamE